MAGTRLVNRTVRSFERVVCVFYVRRDALGPFPGINQSLDCFGVRLWSETSLLGILGPLHKTLCTAVRTTNELTANILAFPLLLLHMPRTGPS